jgi:hypothetical protein
LLVLVSLAVLLAVLLALRSDWTGGHGRFRVVV